MANGGPDFPTPFDDGGPVDDLPDPLGLLDNDGDPDIPDPLELLDDDTGLSSPGDLSDRY